MIVIEKRNGVAVYDKLIKRIERLQDGYYQIDIQHIDGDTRQMRKYYRGAVLPAVAKTFGNTDAYQHERLLEDHAPRIIMGDNEGYLRSAQFSRDHWIYFLNQVIYEYLPLGAEIPEPNTITKINEKYLQDVRPTDS